MQVTPDPMEGEQTWPTKEELADAERERVLKEARFTFAQKLPNCMFLLSPLAGGEEQQAQEAAAQGHVRVPGRLDP